jgi:hypothetical protein
MIRVLVMMTGLALMPITIPTAQAQEAIQVYVDDFTGTEQKDRLRTLTLQFQAALMAASPRIRALAGQNLGKQLEDSWASDHLASRNRIIADMGISLSVFGMVNNFGDTGCDVTIKVFDRGKAKWVDNTVVPCEMPKLREVLERFAEQCAAKIVGSGAEPEPGASQTDESGERSIRDEIVAIGGLVWQRHAAPDAMNWSSAKQYCELITWAGRKDWRLPSISELRSVIRGCPKTQNGGACRVTDRCPSTSCWAQRDCYSCSSGGGPANGCYWPNEFTGKCSWYWSSSSSSYSYENDRYGPAWNVCYDNGYIDYDNLYRRFYVRCVYDKP